MLDTIKLLDYVLLLAQGRRGIAKGRGAKVHASVPGLFVTSPPPPPPNTHTHPPSFLLASLALFAALAPGLQVIGNGTDPS